MVLVGCVLTTYLGLLIFHGQPQCTIIMSPTLRNSMAVLVGAVICLVLNGLLLGLLMKLIPAPIGFDPGITATYGLLQGKHLLPPFIAHALPSLVGGFVAARLAATHKLSMALVVGGLHLVGGVAAAVMIPGPLWFEAADLVLAYLPMAWLGGRLRGGSKR